MCYVCSVRALVLGVVVSSGAVVATPVFAQESEDPNIPRLSRILAAVEPPQIQQGAPIQPGSSSLRQAAERPSSLLPLYVSLGVLQGLDIHSTARGLSAGGREANPVMEPVVKHQPAYIAMKAASTVGIVWAAERLWRKDHRKAAVVLTALTNIGLAAVVAHNYRVAK